MTQIPGKKSAAGYPYLAADCFIPSYFLLKVTDKYRPLPVLYKALHVGAYLKYPAVADYV